MNRAVEPFLHGARRASAGERADAARAVAGAYLYADLGPHERGAAETALTAALDDPSALVRRALAETLATAVDAPHHLVVALAGDQSDIAAIVLERSPILCDADLVDAVAVGDDEAQAAVARRPGLSFAVAGALAEVAARDAVLALCRNTDADLAPLSAQRVLERFEADGEVREALGARRDLEASLRHDLAGATAAVLARFVAERGWLSPQRARRVTAEARDRATLSIAAESAREDEIAPLRLVAHLVQRGHLTPALVLRAVLSGDVLLLEAALAELAGKTPAQVAGLCARPTGLGFAALYRKAGLPAALLPAFRAALMAVGQDDDDASADDRAPVLRRRSIERVLAACAGTAEGESDDLVALLRRFQAEAAREDARARPPMGRASDSFRLRAPDMARFAEPAALSAAA